MNRETLAIGGGLAAILLGGLAAGSMRGYSKAKGLDLPVEENILLTYGPAFLGAAFGWGYVGPVVTADYMAYEYKDYDETDPNVTGFNFKRKRDVNADFYSELGINRSMGAAILGAIGAFSTVAGFATGYFAGKMDNQI